MRGIRYELETVEPEGRNYFISMAYCEVLNSLLDRKYVPRNLGKKKNVKRKEKFDAFTTERKSNYSTGRREEKKGSSSKKNGIEEKEKKSSTCLLENLLSMEDENQAVQSGWNLINMVMTCTHRSRLKFQPLSETKFVLSRKFFILGRNSYK